MKGAWCFMSVLHRREEAEDDDKPKKESNRYRQREGEREWERERERERVDALVGLALPLVVMYASNGWIERRRRFARRFTTSTKYPWLGVIIDFITSPVGRRTGSTWHDRVNRKSEMPFRVYASYIIPGLHWFLALTRLVPFRDYAPAVRGKMVPASTSAV